MGADMQKLESVTTHDLNNGDLVYAHGTIFRLKDGRDCEPRYGETLNDWQGCTRVFETEVVQVEDPRGMPASWRAGWTIQGNKLAKWGRVVH